MRLGMYMHRVQTQHKTTQVGSDLHQFRKRGHLGPSHTLLKLKINMLHCALADKTKFFCLYLLLPLVYLGEVIEP